LVAFLPGMMIAYQLTHVGCARDFSHVTTQVGMFCILGLSTGQVRTLRGMLLNAILRHYEAIGLPLSLDTYHIYMADSSRVSIAGLNEGNVAYVAKAIADVAGDGV